jgi:hypothetical protein
MFFIVLRLLINCYAANWLEITVFCNVAWNSIDSLRVFVPVSPPSHIITNFLPRSACFSTLKMQATGSSEMVLTVCHATQCYVPGDSNVHSNHCDNLRSRSYFLFNHLFAYVNVLRIEFLISKWELCVDVHFRKQFSN